jgi:hypothetical protein
VAGDDKRWSTDEVVVVVVIDADAVPFKNDAVKKAVLREQMKLEATKMGVPLEVVAATQQQLQREDEADDPFAKMVGRGRPAANTAARASSPTQKAAAAPVQIEQEEEEEEEEATQQQQEVSKAGGSCAVM